MFSKTTQSRSNISLRTDTARQPKSLIVERVKAGMRRAKLEGRRIGRAPLEIDREQVVRDRRAGLSLTQVAKKHKISRASVCRLVREAESRERVATQGPNNHGSEINTRLAEAA
jgi:DNA invertase Pin-like site-specific DNA recombinase